MLLPYVRVCFRLTFSRRLKVQRNYNRSQFPSICIPFSISIGFTLSLCGECLKRPIHCTTNQIGLFSRRYTTTKNQWYTYQYPNALYQTLYRTSQTFRSHSHSVGTNHHMLHTSLKKFPFACHFSVLFPVVTFGENEEIEIRSQNLQSIWMILHVSGRLRVPFYSGNTIFPQKPCFFSISLNHTDLRPFNQHKKSPQKKNHFLSIISYVSPLSVCFISNCVVYFVYC